MPISPPPPSAPAHAVLLRLLAWVQAQGGHCAGVHFRVEPDGRRELCASAPFPEGALVLHIPRHLLFTLDAAHASAIGRVAHDSHCRLSDWGTMALHILEERRTGGLHAPYLRALPASHAGLPVLFAPELLAQMQGSYMLPAVLRRRTRLDEEYQRIAQRLPPAWHVTRDDYLWAWCCMQTRYFDTHFGAEHTHALVPLGDMPNHAPAPNLHWRPEATLGMVMTAARPIAAGEPLSISYGAKSNSELLADYGFCLEDNPHDRTEIRLPAWPADHPCADVAAALGTEQAGGLRAFRVRAAEHHASARDLWAWLRLGALPPGQAIDSPEALLSAARSGPLDADNERRARAVLAHACDQRLAEFADPADEDEQLLRQGGLPCALRPVVLARLGEKRLLLHYRNLARRQET